MATATDYIRSRVRPRIAWYDRRAIQYKRISLLTQYVATIASLSVVVLLHLESISHFMVGCVSALAAFAASAERIGQYGHLWQAYRLSAEVLEVELLLYTHHSGPYATVDADARERMLVERTEHIMTKCAGDWRSIVITARSGAEEAAAQ